MVRPYGLGHADTDPISGYEGAVLVLGGRARRLVAAVFGLAAALLLFGRNLVEHMRRGLDAHQYADDVRVQVMAQLRWAQPEVFRDDFIGDYASDITPVGVHLVYRLGALIADPAWLSSVLPYPLLGLTVYGLARASARLAPVGLRGFAAFLSAALVLGCELYLQRMSGGCARAFCFPIVALGLLAVVEGRLILAGGIALAGALLYPTSAVIVAAGLFAVLFVASPDTRAIARRWSLGRRMTALGLFVLALVLATAPTLLKSAKHGPRVTPENVRQYPEGGPGGTHGPEDRPPYDGFFEALKGYAPRGLFGAGRFVGRSFRADHEDRLVFDAVALVALVGLFWGRRRTRLRRFAAFALGVFLAHLTARVLAPYLYAPSRFAMYGVPPLVAVGVSVGLMGLVGRLPAFVVDIGAALTRGRRRLEVQARPAFAFVVSALLLFAVGGRGTSHAGLTIRLDDEHQRLYGFIRSLPPRSLVAGWPDDPMSNVPYAGRRRAFMTGEMHIAFHVGYLEAVRERLFPFFEAYVSADLERLRRLRDERGVTHVLVERRDFRHRNRGYMPPYGARLHTLWRELGSKTPALLAQPKAFVFTSPRYLVVDLARL